MLVFDDETRRTLDLGYLGADVAMRRRVSFDALDPAPGDRILDLGCGTGLLCAELSRAVGAEGRVIGVDPSPDMRRAAEERCADFANVTIEDGSDSDLPVGEGEVDKAVAVQVFEYLDDLPAAARRLHKVLSPGGRLVIADSHLGTLVWHSGNPGRMARMLAAWDRHFTLSDVPARLPAILRDNGFAVGAITPVTICDPMLRPDGLALTLMVLMKAYAVQNGLVEAAEADAWEAEQHELAAEGRFFFALTQFVVAARKI